MVVAALLYLAGLRGILLAGSAVIIAALAAYIFFPGQRNQAAKKLEEIRHREEKPRVRDIDMEAEDAAVDEVLESEDGAAEEQDDADRELD